MEVKNPVVDTLLFEKQQLNLGLLQIGGNRAVWEHQQWHYLNFYGSDTWCDLKFRVAFTNDQVAIWRSDYGESQIDKLQSDFDDFVHKEVIRYISNLVIIKVNERRRQFLDFYVKEPLTPRITNIFKDYPFELNISRSIELEIDRITIL